MEIFRIIGVAFVTAVAAIVLKSSKPELSFAVTVTGVVIILIFVADMLQNTVNIISSIAGMTGIENGLIKILLKIVGIGYQKEEVERISEKEGLWMRGRESEETGNCKLRFF